MADLMKLDRPYILWKFVVLCSGSILLDTLGVIGLYTQLVVVVVHLRKGG